MRSKTSENSSLKTSIRKGQVSTLQQDLTTEKRMDLIMQWIVRYDELCSSIENRASFVLSAGAIFLGGMTFLIGQFSSNPPKWEVGKQLFIGAASLLMIFLILSIIQASFVIVNLRRTKQSLTTAKIPKTDRNNDLLRIKDQLAFKDAFRNCNTQELFEYALHEFWAVESLYRNRYRNLIKAVWLLIFAIFPFGVCAIILLNPTT
jgi:hypothetical protein